MPTAKQPNGSYKCRFNHTTETAFTEDQYRAYMHGKASQAKTQRQIEEKAEQEEQKKERESQADRVYKLFLEQDIQLFHDQNKIEYARLPLEITNGTNDTNGTFQNLGVSFEVGKLNERAPQIPETTVNTVSTVRALETVRLKDEKFKTYLAHLLYEAEEKILNKESASQVILLLKYDASHGKKFNLYNRVAPDPTGDGSIWLDMADQYNRAYHITENGWTIETNVPILFRRYEHQKALAIAIKGGDCKKLLPFVNVGANKNSVTSKHRELLLLIQTASYIIPDIAHPINAMFGSPGSHKSSAQRFIREIFDPSSAPLLRLPRDENASLQVLDHHYMPIFDNIDYLPRWLSDMLCCAVTGTGQESRVLYTDDDSFIRSFRRCILLNGLNLPTTKGDLLNRTIMHPTEPTILRKTEADLNGEYAKVLPEILGGFLDAVAYALKIKNTVVPSKMFRLADFTEWGCALAVALGFSSQDFIAAMEENLNSQNVADIDNNLAADMFLRVVQEALIYADATEDNPRKLTPEELYTQVCAKAEELKINIKTNKKWPSASNSYTRKLNESKNAIIASGWNYETSHDGTKRVFAIWRIQSEKPDDDKKATNPTIPEDKAQLTLRTEETGLKRLVVNPEYKPAQKSDCLEGEKIHYLVLSDNDQDTHKCCNCEGVQAKYKVTNPSNEKFFVCSDCFREYRFTFEPQGVRFVNDTMPDYEEDA